MTFNQSITTSLEDSLVAFAPMGVSIVHDLPGGWLAIIARHPDKRAYVDYLKHPPEQLYAFALTAAERWAAN